MAEKKETPDRLHEIIKGKKHNCLVAEKSLTLHKWTLRQGIRVSGKLIGMIQKFIPTGNMTDLLITDIGELTEKYEDDFVESLVVSIQKGNFETEEEALTWVEALSLEEAIELFVEVARLNVIPLARKVGSFGALLSAAKGPAEGSVNEQVQPVPTS